MSIPSWYELLLLSLASFRVWRLIAEDDIAEKPRHWAIVQAQRWKGNGAAVLAKDFLACVWCAGFWVSLAWWGLWEAWPHGVTIAAVPFAISAIVGLIGHFASEDS